MSYNSIICPNCGIVIKLNSQDIQIVKCDKCGRVVRYDSFYNKNNPFKI